MSIRDCLRLGWAIVDAWSINVMWQFGQDEPVVPYSLVRPLTSEVMRMASSPMSPLPAARHAEYSLVETVLDGTYARVGLLPAERQLAADLEILRHRR